MNAASPRCHVDMRGKIMTDGLDGTNGEIHGCSKNNDLQILILFSKKFCFVETCKFCLRPILNQRVMRDIGTPKALIYSFPLLFLK